VRPPCGRRTPGCGGEFERARLTVKIEVLEQEATMPKISRLGRVIVPVSSQDEAISFYTGTLGFSVAADVPFGENDRWVEVSPPGGGAAIALVPPQGEYQPGRMTGIALESSDPRADHAELMGGDGTVPLMFFFRDNNANQLLVVQAP
jgi:catechol 2,3-dioxygenase-like lactoylglutathione lyase family enzyme